MDTDDIIAGLALFFFIVEILLLVASVGLLYKFRNVPAISARLHPLDGIWWVMLALLTIRMYYIILSVTSYKDAYNCIAFVWVSLLFPAAALAVFMKCWRLLLIFTTTKLKLEQTQQENEKQINLLQVLNSLSSTRVLILTYMLLVVLISFVPLYSTVYTIRHNLDPKNEATCVVIPNRVGTIFSIPFTLLFIIGVAFKLRKVHDAFWIKLELKLLALGLILIVLPSIIMVSISSVTHWGYLLASLAPIAGTIFSFHVPIILAIRDHIRSSTSASESSRSEEVEAKKEDSLKKVEEAEVVPEDKLTHIFNSLSQDSIAVKFLEEYILHHQQIQLSHCLLLYFEIVKFEKLENDTARIGKSWIIFQKFLEENAYLYVDCVDQKEREKIKAIIMQCMDEDSKTTVDRTIFEDIKKVLQELLINNLVAKFYKSNFYKEYRKSVSLRRIQKEVTTW